MNKEKRLVGGGGAEKCSECGGAMTVRVSTMEDPYLYEMGGLENMRLIGVKILTCETCEEESVQIPRIGQLHASISHALFQKKGLLIGEEVRFLRKNAGLMAKDFAAFIGITPEHLSRIENGKTETLGEPADKLARAVAMASYANTEEYQAFLRSKSASGTSTRSKKVFRLRSSGWAEAA